MEQVKSTDRVRDLGEVFTAEKEVNSILDLLDNAHIGEYRDEKDSSNSTKTLSNIKRLEKNKGAISNIHSRIFEPACGNGNFLEEILHRKLISIKVPINFTKKDITQYQYNVLIALSNIYGVDIDETNVVEARERLYNFIISHMSLSLSTERLDKRFYYSIRAILNTNIVLGDTLNGTEKLFFIFYYPKEKNSFMRIVWRFVDLYQSNSETLYEKKPLTVLADVNMFELSDKQYTFKDNSNDELSELSLKDAKDTVIHNGKDPYGGNDLFSFVS